MNCTIIVPYYRAPQMLSLQLANWSNYSERAREAFTFVVIDDGSPEAASDIIKESDGVELYRVHVDIPWHRNPCRNLGAHLCRTEWLIQIDIDHLLPPDSAEALLDTEVSPKYWYRFPRWRIGKADETRRKDSIPVDCEYGRIKEHIDSYLITKKLFLKSPYDEEYQGFLGGGSPFLERMRKLADVRLLPEDVCLHVYTRHKVPDASVSTLSRDTSHYAKLRKQKELMGRTKPTLRLDFPWSRVV